MKDKIITIYCLCDDLLKSSIETVFSEITRYFPAYLDFFACLMQKDKGTSGFETKASSDQQINIKKLRYNFNI